MKNIKTTSDLIAKCRGKYLLMQSRKDVHSELDARKASNDLSYLFIVKVEETGPAKAMRMHDTPYYSYAAYLANGRFETKIEIDHLLAMVQYNVKRGNVVTAVDEYAKPELIAKLAEYGTAVADRIKLNLALLKPHESSREYVGREGKAPYGAVLHNHGYPYDMMSYRAKGIRHTMSTRYHEMPSMENDVQYFQPHSFLTASNYFNRSNSDWSVYKAPAKVINQVHANNLTIIILAKQIKALLTGWMMGMEIKPR
jgi:hypothetical protein